MNRNTDETGAENALNENVLPRRRVLRGALAAGCGLLLPAALFGCDSQKGEAPTAAAPPGPPAGSPDAAAPASTPKATQASVQYQPQPKGDQKCSGCQHFIAESNTCQLVEGQISPDGWCTLWTQKT